MSTRISKNFTIDEFRVSESYPELAAEIEFSFEDLVKVRMLTTLFLQPVRDEFGRVVITSGKRSPELNQAIGGSANSDHLFPTGGTRAAVDFTCPTASMEDVYRFLRLRGPHTYGQLLHYRKSNFIHVSLPDSEFKVGESWDWEK